MFEFFPTNWSELIITYEQYCKAYPGEKEDFLLSQKLYNQLSDLNTGWIWMLGAGVYNSETHHLVNLFQSAAAVSDKIEFYILEADMMDEPVLFCYLKTTSELVGDFIVSENYERTAEHDQTLFDNLHQSVKQWKEFIPNALN